MKVSECDFRQTVILNLLSQTRVACMEQYQLNKLLFNVTGVAIKSSYIQSLKYAVKKILWNSFDIKLNLTGKDLMLFTYNYKRNDHRNSWGTIKKLFDDYDEIIMEELTFRNRKVIPLSVIIKSVMLCLKIMHEIKKCGTLKERIVLASHLVELSRLDACMLENKIKNKVVLTFFDGGSYENLIIQKLRNKGVKTVTMQHGQPVFHGMECDRINQTMILNFSSDFILVTGEYSKKQFQLGGIPDTSIKVVGSWRSITEFNEKKRQTFSVFLDCPTYVQAKEDNLKMITVAESIAKKHNLNYIIKLHPQDDADEYSKVEIVNGIILEKDKTVEDALVDSFFTILHASGVYLEIMSKGIKSFCMLSKMDFPLVEYEMDKFASIGELDLKLRQWNDKSTTEKIAYMNEIVDYYLSPNNSLNRHKEFIESQIESCAC